MQKKILIAVVLLLGLIIASSVIFKPEEIISLRGVNDHDIITGELFGKNLTIEIVKTPQSIGTGLGNRDSFELDGMLFIFSEPSQPIFWMKGMKFPIDLYWIRDMKIIGVDENIQPPVEGTPDDDIERYGSLEEVDMVLEIPVEKGIKLSF
jgi:uncharacterized membrane protein (UPF0127 family)